MATTAKDLSAGSVDATEREPPVLPIPSISSHFPALDGLRGVAILLVLFYHGNVLIAPDGKLENFLFRVAWAGWSGVDLFFVLSGFLITGILYDTKQSKHFFRHFYARRVLRIFPVYYFSLVLFFFVFHPLKFGDDPRFAELPEHQVWYWTYLSNLWLCALGRWPEPPHLNHFWSLSIEEQFYFVWPLVVFLFDRRRLLWISAGCVVGALLLRSGIALSLGEMAGQDWIVAYVLTPARIDCLAVGAFIALTARSGGGVARLLRWAPWAAAGSALAIAILVRVYWGYGFHPGGSPGVQTIGLSAVAIFSGSLLVFAFALGKKSAFVRLLSTPVLRAFGKFSYAIYVFHYPVILEVIMPEVRDRFFPRTGMNSITAMMTCYVATISLCFGVGWLSWNGFEKHILKLKDRFPY